MSDESQQAKPEQAPTEPQSGSRREHLESDTFVLLLGAGASAPWNAPVMAQFMNKVQFHFYNHRRAQNPFAEHYDHMLSFRQECRSSAWLFNRDWDNIEELYTQADLLRLMYKDRQIDGIGLSGNCVCQHIAWAIWDVYRICKVEDPPVFGGFFSNVRTRLNLKPAVITTNYDVLCEVGSWTITENANQIIAPCFYPGFGQHKLEMGTDRVLHQDDQDYYETGIAGGSTPIVKLHGSVNWFEKQDDNSWRAVDFSARSIDCRWE